MNTKLRLEPLLNPYPKLQPYPKERRLTDITGLPLSERIKLYSQQTRKLTNPYKARYSLLSGEDLKPMDRLLRKSITLNPNVVSERQLLNDIMELRSYKPLSQQSTVEKEKTRKLLIKTNARIADYVKKHLSPKNAEKRMKLVLDLLATPSNKGLTSLLQERAQKLTKLYGTEHRDDFLELMKKISPTFDKIPDEWLQEHPGVDVPNTKTYTIQRDALFILAYFLMSGEEKNDPRAGIDLLIGEEPSVGEKLDAKVLDEDGDDEKKDVTLEVDSEMSSDEEPEPTSAATAAAATAGVSREDAYI